MPERPVYEVGLVLAGAISAGCYSAGVMDFLIEALDGYYAARDAPGWDGPTHDVRVPVLAGASAGGMTAGMAALHMFRRLDHVQPAAPPPPEPQNRLYASWVRDIAIERLLETGDLDGTTGLRSVLCSAVLDDILGRAFAIDGPPVRRPWIGRGGRDALRVMLTLTNLRGVPYSFGLVGAGANRAFGMTNHADVASFELGSGRAPTGDPWLDVTRTDDPAWDFFKVAALATGAFPVGLAPRHVSRPGAELLTWGTVGRVDADGRFVVIPPDDRYDVKGTARYWAVDGGTIDNEPLEQARRYLTNGYPDEPAGDKARRSVVLIAPFPNYQALPADPVTGTLATALPGLFSALINQARFKPDELARAHDGSDFSRFIVSPVRQRADGKPVMFPIASGALGGFSGFLHESFRRHDYLLGRRNAQAFLRWNFVLPATNDLFKGPTIAEHWKVRDASAATGSVAPGGESGFRVRTLRLDGGPPEGVALYPIIPLTPELQKPIEIGKADRARPEDVRQDLLRGDLKRRIEKVVSTLVDIDFRKETDDMGVILGYLARKGAKTFGVGVASRKVDAIVARTITALKADFPAHDTDAP
ncbi:patatin-like phospholipase family protein [Methylobacterium indicum]|uniref:patatin-like phospholipase family protein n=1 Tax=Methylobacterium indicum TaxID=1775910 RepID=UPI00073444A1|nr:patatin-like phospholipase family protein [Methylobacterium indicum]